MPKFGMVIDLQCRMRRLRFSLQDGKQYAEPEERSDL